METHTKEKSLVVVNNSVFTKLKKFFMKLFIKNQIEIQDTQKIEEHKNNEENYESETKNESEADATKRTGKLFNYDAYDNDMINNVNEENIQDESVENDNIGEDYYDTEKSPVYKEKEELERKLMNYYASITKDMMSNE